MILVGDIGGTHVRLATAVPVGEKISIGSVKTYQSKAFSSLEGALRQFARETPGRIERACFGVPGPVDGNRCTTTNLPWVIDGSELGRAMDIEWVQLLNDLEATAHGVLALSSAGLRVLQAGRQPAHGNRVVVAAGTGLGQAGIYWDGARHHPFATEGGHTEFGPRDDREWRLTKILQERWGRVSVEGVVSGPGIESIFRFLQHEAGGPMPAWFDALGAGDDRSVVIGLRALDASDSLCERTLDWFASLYGCEAGNVALKHMARGGVYIAGGIAPQVLDPSRARIFMDAFLAKGRMRRLLEGVPVSMVLDDTCALLGAGAVAHRVG